MVRLNEDQRDGRATRGNGARYVFENLQRAVGPEVCLEAFRMASDAEHARSSRAVSDALLVGRTMLAPPWSRCIAIVPVTHRARKVIPLRETRRVPREIRWRWTLNTL